VASDVIPEHRTESAGNEQPERRSGGRLTVTNPRSTGVALAPGFVRRTVITLSGRVNELTDGMVCSVDAVTKAEIGPWRKYRLT